MFSGISEKLRDFLHVFTQRKPQLHYELYDSIQPALFEGKLAGSVVLVTGGGRGLGREIALAFARSGASVAIISRTQGQVDKTVSDISILKAKAVGIAADVTNLEEMKLAVKKIESELGKITHLVLNAGNNFFEPFSLSQSESWWSIMELKVKAPADLIRLVLPGMTERNAGCIIMTGSKAGCLEFPYTTSYSCASSAQIKLAGCLQKELDMKFINVQMFVIHPGEMDTELNRKELSPEVIANSPELVELREKMAIQRMKQHFNPDLAAWTSVMIATGKANALKGRYIDCTRDIGHVLARAKSIRDQDLYKIAVNML